MSCKFPTYRVEFRLKNSTEIANSISWMRIRFGKNKDCFELKVSSSVFQITRENKIFASIRDVCELKSHREHLKCIFDQTGYTITGADLLGELISTSQYVDRMVPLFSLSEYFRYVGDAFKLSNSLQVRLKNGTEANIFENGMIHVYCGQTIESVTDSITFLRCCIDDHQYLLGEDPRHSE